MDVIDELNKTYQKALQAHLRGDDAIAGALVGGVLEELQRNGFHLKWLERCASRLAEDIKNKGKHRAACGYNQNLTGSHPAIDPQVHHKDIQEFPISSIS